MIEPATSSFLKALLDTPGPSGFESGPANLWRREAEGFSIVSKDVAGNSMAKVIGKGGPTIMLAGHIDEIGVIVTYIDENGFVYIAPIGGWDPQVLVAQRIRFMGRHGDVIGVVGKLPIHLMKSDDREKAAKMTDLWVDIGVRNRKEAEEMLSIGDAGVINSTVVELPNGRIVSRAIDNRIGAFIVLEALRRYSKEPGQATVVAVATSQEEIGLMGGGALVGAASVNPDMAIVVDVTFATDHPCIEKKEIGDSPLGSGPVLSRGSVISPIVFNILRQTAVGNGIPYTIQASGRYTSTDADAIHIAREGVATGLVSIPNRYMHSPNEMVSLKDVDLAAELLARACLAVTSEVDFTDR